MVAGARMRRSLVIGITAGLLFPASMPAQAAFPGDNGLIVFTRGKPSQIYVMRSDGSRVRSLTSGRRFKGSASWSPSGNRIAYAVGDRFGSSFPRDLYVMRADGSHQHVILDVSGRTEVTSPSWPPDGKRIAIIKGTPHGRHLFVLRADGSHLRRVDYDGYVGYWAEWSPDGRRIVFEGSSDDCANDIFSVRTSGGRLHKLTCNVTKKPEGQGGDTYGQIAGAGWAPDGTRIVFAASRGEAETKIYVMDRNGDDVTLLKPGQQPAYSPDGRLLVFTLNGDIYRMRVDGTGARRLTRKHGFESVPHWQPR